jgi:hypothetical protein
MNRRVVSGVLSFTLAGAVVWSGCSTATGKSADQSATERAPIAAPRSLQSNSRSRASFVRPAR